MKNDLLSSKELRVTHADRKRLLPYLSGWNRLCDILRTGLFKEDDLRKLIILEAENQKRETIIEKLVGSYLSKLRTRVLNQIKNEIPQTQNP